MKVAHHGSKYSTSEEFLTIIKPELSFISCGKDNWYGHPHPELLSRLKEINSKVIISYESETVKIETDGRRIKVRNYLRDLGLKINLQALQVTKWPKSLPIS